MLVLRVFDFPSRVPLIQDCSGPLSLFRQGRLKSGCSRCNQPNHRNRDEDEQGKANEPPNQHPRHHPAHIATHDP